MKNGLFVLALIPAAIALTGCGGGSGATGGSNSDLYAENMVVDAGANQAAPNNNGVVVSVLGKAYNENRVIESMNWVLKNAPSDPRTTVTLSNPTCSFTAGSTAPTGSGNWKDIKECATSVTIGSVPQNEEIVLLLTAVDSGGHSRSDDVSITVSNAASKLAADAGPDLNVSAGSEIKTGCSFTGGIWFDPKAKNPLFRWYIKNGDTLKLNGQSFSISWDTKTGDLTAKAPANVNKPFLVELACEVTDESGYVSTDVANYNVQSTPPLVAAAGKTQTIRPDALVTLDGSGTVDPINAGLPIYYQWTQLAGTSVILNSPNSVSSSFTSPTVAKTESLVFQLAVSRDAITDLTVFATTEKAQTSVTVLGGADLGALVVVASDSQAVETSAAVTMSATVTDPAGGTGPFYYQWVQLSGSPVVITNANTANASFVAPDTSADLVFEVGVSRQPITAGTVFLTTEKAQTSVGVRPPASS